MPQPRKDQRPPFTRLRRGWCLCAYISNEKAMLLDVSLDVAGQHGQVRKNLAMTNCSPLLVWEDVDVLVNVSKLKRCTSMTFLFVLLQNYPTSH